MNTCYTFCCIYNLYSFDPFQDLITIFSSRSIMIACGIMVAEVVVIVVIVVKR